MSEQSREGIGKKLLDRLSRVVGGPFGQEAKEPAPDHDDVGHALSEGLRPGRGFEDRHVDSPILPLCSEEQIERAVSELRKMLAEDDSPERKQALKGEIAKGFESFGHWFQRIDFPEHNITSTSDHARAYIDEGGLNTLGKKLSSTEASILRPWPKWYYIKPLLPALEGKSVLELGSSNGFFSFRFAEMGAAKVTGVEILKLPHDASVWSQKILKHDSIEFINTDAVTDMTIPRHDIVFLSEVHNHFLFPFMGLLRIVNLAKERVIFDTGADPAQNQSLNLYSGWDTKSNTFLYHSFELTDGLIMNFLNLIGVRPSKVKRYVTPREERHILYDIDTTEVEKTREEFRYPLYLSQVVNMSGLASRP